MPSGIYERRLVGRKNPDLKSIALLLQSSQNIDGFYSKMREVYKEKYSLQNINSYWKEKSKIIPKHIIETRTTPATVFSNSSLKDSETYLSEIVNEMRLLNQISQETLALFKRLEEKPKNGA